MVFDPVVKTKYPHNRGEITTFNNQLIAISDGNRYYGKIEVLENESWDDTKIESVKDFPTFPLFGFTCLVVPSGLGDDYLYTFGKLVSRHSLTLYI